MTAANDCMKKKKKPQQQWKMKWTMKKETKIETKSQLYNQFECFPWVFDTAYLSTNKFITSKRHCFAHKIIINISFIKLNTLMTSLNHNSFPTHSIFNNNYLFVRAKINVKKNLWKIWKSVVFVCIFDLFYFIHMIVFL